MRAPKRAHVLLPHIYQSHISVSISASTHDRTVTYTHTHTASCSYVLRNVLGNCEQCDVRTAEEVEQAVPVTPRPSGCDSASAAADATTAAISSSRSSSRSEATPQPERATMNMETDKIMDDTNNVSQVSCGGPHIRLLCLYGAQQSAGICAICELAHATYVIIIIIYACLNCMIHCDQESAYRHTDSSEYHLNTRVQLM